jgi:phosphoribosylformimino-5-aminoimidazole carboxamide ribotide isomerase
MRFLPVLDVLNGVVVRAVGGRRSEYRPLVSWLTDSTKPLVVAEAIREKYGWSELYVADLDAIVGERRGLSPSSRQTAGINPAVHLETQRGLIDGLHGAGFRLWLDAGVREPADAEQLAEAGVDRVICGLETLCDLEAWREIMRKLTPERAVFSLDMQDGRPLKDGTDPLPIADRVIADGCRQIIVLDLARVGLRRGLATEALCTELLSRYRGLDVFTGGGIRGWEEVRQLDAAGVTGVLLSSSLHDGSLTAHSHFQQ